MHGLCTGYARASLSAIVREKHASRLEVLLRHGQQAAQRHHALGRRRRPEGLQLLRQLDGAGRLRHAVELVRRVVEALWVVEARLELVEVGVQRAWLG